MPSASVKQVPPVLDLEMVAGRPFALTLTCTGATVTAAAVTMYKSDGTATTAGPPDVTTTASVITIVWSAADTTALWTASGSRSRAQYTYTVTATVDGSGPYDLVARLFTIREPGSAGAAGGTAATLGFTVGATAVTVAVSLGGTGSPTAAELLTAIKTVDGAGSGLDADTVDGLEAAAFALSGHVHEGGVYQPLDGDLTTLAGAGNSAVLAATTASFLTADETKLDGVEAGATADQTAAEILTAIKTVDGSGSGLDADTIDGTELAALATQSELDDAVAAEVSARNTAISAAVAALINGAPGAFDALNELAAAMGNDPNFATTMTNALAGKQPLAAVLTATTASFTTADETKLDGIESGATADQSAAEILAALLTVDGTGSGLDADLLDGVSSAGFQAAGAAAGGVLAGTYPNPSFAADMATQAELDAAVALRQPIDADLTALAAANNSAVLAATTASFLTADATKLDGVEALAEVNDTAAEILTKLLTVDGAASGLDADLLDGQSSGSFATAAHDHTGTYQPLDGDLTALAALTTTSFGRSVLELATAGAGEWVAKGLYDVNSILVATANDTPLPLTVAASRIVGRKATGDIGALTSADVSTLLGLGTAATTAATDYATAAQGATADAAVPKSLYDANTILIATADNTPAALTVAASRILGRKATGDIVALTGAETSTVLGLGNLATATTITEYISIALSDETTAITTGTSKTVYRMPFAGTLIGVRASLSVVSSSGIPTVDINKGQGGTTVLSTKLTIDASELTSVTAAAAAVISDSTLADDQELAFDIDVAGTGAKGLKVTLIVTRTV